VLQRRNVPDRRCRPKAALAPARTPSLKRRPLPDWATGI